MRSLSMACSRIATFSCPSPMVPSTNCDKSSFMSSASLSTERMVSMTSCGVEYVIDEEDSSNLPRSASKSESRMGAQRCRSARRISRICVIAERRGEDVGESGEDRVTRTIWFDGRRGLRAM